MRSTEHSRGLSLAEVLVASSLLLVVCSLAIQALQFSLDYQREKELERGIVEDALNALRQIQRGLEETDIRSVYIEPDAFLAYLSPRDSDGRLLSDPETGSLLYAKGISVSLRDKELIQKTSLFDEPQSSNKNVLDFGFDRLYFESRPPSRVFTTNCSSFKVGYTDRLGNPSATLDGRAQTEIEEPALPDTLIKVALKVQRKGRKTHAITVDSSIFPRN